MYRINIDVIKKLLIVEISGRMPLEEVQVYINDLTATVKKFDEKELSMLILAQRMDPLPQECINLFKEAIILLLTSLKKVAVVHSRFVTQMQMRRLEEEVKTENIIEGTIMRFKTKKDALQYLNSRY